MNGPTLRGLPDGWTSTTIGEVCRLVAGVGFPEHLQGVAAAEIPVFKVGDISRAWQAGQIRLNESRNTVAADVALSLSARLVPPLTVVFAKIGAAIALNRRAITGRPCLIDNNVMGLVPCEGLDSLYLFYFSCTLNLDEHARATTVPSIRKGDVASISFPLPPRSEQRKLVEAIECHLTRLDDAVCSLRRVQAKLKAYRASLLKAAVEGRLVPTEASLARADKRNYEPAEALLDRILKQRRRRWEEAELAKLKAPAKTPKDDNWKSKYVQPIAPHMIGLTELPEGWCWASTDQLCAEITDGDHQPPPVSQTGVPFLVIGNVRRGALAFSGCRTVPQSYYDNLNWKRKPDSKDLLYTVVGSLGIPVRIAEDRPFCVQRHIAILKAPHPEVKDYLFYALASGFVFQQAARMATGTAQKTLGLGSLRKLLIPIPPVAEMVRINSEIEQLVSIGEKLTTSVMDDVLRVHRLRRAVLKWAFEGKLVDQDLTDEPAEKLLTRIRADRAAAIRTTPASRRTVTGVV